MKIIKWVLAFLTYCISYVLSTFLLQFFFIWAVDLGGWRWLALLFWLPTAIFASGITIAVPAWISPNPIKAVLLIRWFTLVSLIIGVFITGFELNVPATSNLIFALFVVFFSNRKNIMIYLKGA